MKLYKHPRKALFNGYINTPRMDTVDAVVEKTIYGEDNLWFLETDKKKLTTQYDANGYVTGQKMEIPIGIHKTRLIRWKDDIQLSLF